jgi:hypothetical protein
MSIEETTIYMIRIWGGVGLCIQEGIISVWVCIYGVRAQDRFIEAVDTSLDRPVGWRYIVWSVVRGIVAYPLLA